MKTTKALCAIFVLFFALNSYAQSGTEEEQLKTEVEQLEQLRDILKFDLLPSVTELDLLGNNIRDSRLHNNDLTTIKALHQDANRLWFVCMEIGENIANLWMNSSNLSVRESTRDNFARVDIYCLDQAKTWANRASTLHESLGGASLVLKVQ